MLKFRAEAKAQEEGQVPYLSDIYRQSGEDEKFFRRHILHVAAVDNIEPDVFEDMVTLWPMVLESIKNNVRINSARRSELAVTGHVYIYVEGGDVKCDSISSGSLAPQLFWKVRLDNGQPIQTVSHFLSHLDRTDILTILLSESGLSHLD